MFQNENTFKALVVNANHAATEILASMHSHHPKTVMDLAEAEEVYELTTPSHTENLEPIRSFLATIAQKAGFDEMAVMEIEVAVEEACVNAIKHAHKNDATKPLRLRITIDHQKLTVVMSDQGQGVQFCSFYCAEYLFCVGADNYHCYECMGKIWIKNKRMRSHTSIEDELTGLI